MSIKNNSDTNYEIPPADGVKLDLSNETLPTNFKDLISRGKIIEIWFYKRTAFREPHYCVRFIEHSHRVFFFTAQ